MSDKCRKNEPHLILY